MEFSAYQMLSNTVIYLSRNMDNLLTGKTMGEEKLGYYNKAYELMLYPNGLLAGVLTPAIHPILSEFQNEKDLIYEKNLKITRVLFLFGIYVSGICIMASEEIITVAYGNQWGYSIPCLRVMAFSIAFQVVTATTGAFFQSLNDTKGLFIAASINAGINLCFILIGIFKKSIYILSICVSFAFIMNFFVSYMIMMVKSFKRSYIIFLKDIRKYLLLYLCIVMFSSVVGFDLSNSLVSLIAKCICLLVLYMILLLLFREPIFINVIRSRLFQEER